MCIFNLMCLKSRKVAAQKLPMWPFQIAPLINFFFLSISIIKILYVYFKIIIIFETQLPHHNIKNLNQFKLKTVCLLLYLPIVYLNYRIEHRLILSTNN